jgi:hypothetical protein
VAHHALKKFPALRENYVRVQEAEGIDSLVSVLFALVSPLRSRGDAHGNADKIPLFDCEEK